MSGRQIRLQAESTSLVEVPPRHGPGSLDVDDLLDRCLCREVAAVTDRAAGDISCPTDQAGLALRRGEARELDDLVDPQLPLLQSLGEPRQPLERNRCRDPAMGLPGGQAVPDREPMGGVARPVVTPCLAAIDLRDQTQEPPMRLGDQSVSGIDLPNEMRGILEHATQSTGMPRSGL